nr:Ger(x)C family spore germination protein [Paenibacillus catalpae]
MLILLLLSMMTGCTQNRREPDRLAFDMGEGLDLTDDGKLEVSFQIAIPAGLSGGQDSGGGGTDKSFELTSATGINVSDAMRNMQKKLSRELFPGHREVVVIGQPLAEKGIGHLLDQFVRNPRSELRSKLFVVKDAQAKKILSKKSVFEPYMSIALKRQEDVLSLHYMYFRDFMADTFTEGVHPSAPAIALTADSKPYYYGIAVFNKTNGLKLAGFLDDQESVYTNWMTGRQSSFDYSLNIAGKEHDNISLYFTNLEYRVHTRIVNKQIKVDLYLTGSGTVAENNTNLNPAMRKELRLLENIINSKIQKEVQQLIKKVQQQYHSDIFRFGEALHYQHPRQWHKFKGRWDNYFSELQVSVKVKMKCKTPGQVTAPVELK